VLARDRRIVAQHYLRTYDNEDDHELGAEHDGERDARAGAGTPVNGVPDTRSPIRQARGTMRKDSEVHSGYYTEVASVLQTGSVR
jgi:hypothetical protein